MAILLVVLGLLVLVAVFIIGIYNRLVALRQTCNQAWSDIEVQLKQRQDLVPQLVNTVKGYAKHEKSTLEEVINCLLYTSPSPRDQRGSRMPSSA